MKILPSLLFAIVYTVICLILRPTSSVLSILIGSFIASIIFHFLFSFFVKKMQYHSYNRDIDFGEPLLNKSLVNYRVGILTRGGVGYLLADKFIFIPSKFNFSKQQVISYSEIKNITKNIILGVIIVKLKLKSGKTETFVFENNNFYENLQKKIS